LFEVSEIKVSLSTRLVSARTDLDSVNENPCIRKISSESKSQRCHLLEVAICVTSTLVSLFVYGNDHTSLPIFRCLSHQATCTHSNPQNNINEERRLKSPVISQPVAFLIEGFEYFRSELIAARSLWCLDGYRRTLAAVMVLSSPKCTSRVSNDMIVTAGLKNI